MKMRSFGIQTVPSSVENRNLSLANLTKLFKDVCLDFRRKTTVSVFDFFFGKKKLREKEEMLEREGQTERHSSSLLFETLYSSHHFMAIIVN